MALPDIITHQDFLLSINTNDHPIIKDALPGIDIWPLMLDPENAVWILRAHYHPGTKVHRHFHTGVVHAYTVSGCWYYAEYPDEKQTAGSYLYEPAGSVHQLVVPEDNEGVTDVFMVVYGANINFDDEGNYVGIMDAGWIETAVGQYAAATGLTFRYIKPKTGGHDFSDRA
jgi:2,4'-dihydroxyacetophenone dioxygenase